MPFDLLGEVGTLEPWLWRGWRYVFSSQYRAQRHATWKASSNLYVVTDIVLCIVVMGAGDRSLRRCRPRAGELSLPKDGRRESCERWLGLAWVNCGEPGQ